MELVVMKKSIFIMLLILSILLVGSQINKAEASDYYLGVYDNGQKAYLITETLKYSPYKYEEDGAGKYTCTVKAVFPNSNTFDKVYYEVNFGQMGAVITKNGRNYDRHEMVELRKKTNSVEMKLVDFIKYYHQQEGRGSLDNY